MDFEHICRICLGNINLISIFKFRRNTENMSQCEDLSLKIRTCSDVEIFENDGLPDKICQDCKSLLTSAHKFRELSAESDKKIRSSLDTEVIEYSFADANHPLDKNARGPQLLDHSPIKKESVDEEEIFEVSYYADNYSYVTQKYDKYGSNFKCVTNEKNVENKFNTERIDSNLLKTNNTTNYDSLPVHKEIYNCEKCQKSFKKRQSLKAHQFLHSGIKKYVCEMCGWSFARQDYLVKHVKTHLHNRPYTCSIKECNYASAQRSSLVQHMRIHTKEKPFHCKECDFSSATSGNLLQHTKVMHRMRELFKCEICFLSFKRKDTLKEHTSVMHCGIKPICNYCDVAFNAKSSLYKHLKCKHHIKHS